MTDPTHPKNTSALENQLDTLYQAASPDPAFADRLERQLRQRASRMHPGPASFMDSLRSFFRRPALAIALGALALLLVATGIAGPQKVFAEIQRLLGYAPGNGFVQPGETRLLGSLVEQQREGVTLRISTVLADSRQTEVSLTVSGLPHEKFGPQEGENPLEAQPYLLLPDGTRLAQSGAVSGIGETLQASLSFPALPAGIHDVTLVLPRLPSLPAGFAPENWSVPLQLLETSSAETASAAELALAQPYAPVNASVSAQGVTVDLLQVGQSPQETGLQVQYRWENRDWKWLSSAELALSDDRGQSYPRRVAEGGPAFEPGQEAAREGARTATYRFDPLDPQAKEGVLAVERLTFSFTSPAGLRFNPGQNVHPGERWDLSQIPGSRIELGGVPAQVLEASLSEGQAPAAGQEAHYQLDVLLQADPAGAVTLDNAALSLYPDREVSSSCEVLGGGRFRLTVDLPALPSGAIGLYFPRGEVNVAGPWEVRWEIPAKR